MAVPDDMVTVECDDVATPELGGGDDAAPLGSGGDTGSNSND